MVDCGGSNSFGCISDVFVPCGMMVGGGSGGSGCGMVVVVQRMMVGAGGGCGGSTSDCGCNNRYGDERFS